LSANEHPWRAMQIIWCQRNVKRQHAAVSSRSIPEIHPLQGQEHHSVMFVISIASGTVQSAQDYFESTQETTWYISDTGQSKQGHPVASAATRFTHQEEGPMHVYAPHPGPVVRLTAVGTAANDGGKFEQMTQVPR
jgi:hypothetical protein